MTVIYCHEKKDINLKNSRNSNLNFFIMKINEFIANFADQFEETEVKVFAPETRYRDLDEWSSLIALSILAMIDEEYDVQLKGEEMRGTNTIKELFDLVVSKLA